jgi:hypothetical protein
MFCCAIGKRIVILFRCFFRPPPPHAHATRSHIPACPSIVLASSIAAPKDNTHGACADHHDPDIEVFL